MNALNLVASNDAYTSTVAIMRDAQRWLLFKSEKNEATGKYDKMPHYVSGRKRCGKQNSPEDLAQLATYRDACVARDLRGEGWYLGFALGFDSRTDLRFHAIDLDNVVENSLAVFANTVGGYVEVSISGKGAHAFGVGRYFATLASNTSGIEAYSDGQAFLVTEHILRDSAPVCLAPYVETELAPIHAAAKAAGNLGHGGARSLVTVDPGSLAPELHSHLQSALSAIPADDYGLWLRMLMALASLGDNAKPLALAWSATSPKFNADAFFEKWAGLNPTETDHRAVFAEAKRHGWKNPGRMIGADPSLVDFTPFLPSQSIWPVPTPIDPSEWLHSSASPRAIIANLIYQDIGVMIAAGGVGKTTILLWMAVHAALDIAFCGRDIETPGVVVFLTGEDGREMLVARLRSIVNAMFPFGGIDMGEREAIIAKVRERIIIIDVSANVQRLTMIERDVVRVDIEAVDALARSLERLKPSLLIIDPAVSFGVGEARVNDAEQGLIEAGRRLRTKVGCAVIYVHHTGKVNGREKNDDQYSGRGGSAFADGSRMVFVLTQLEPAEWAKQTGQRLEAGETGLKINIAKLSYCQRQSPIYVLRKGYSFTAISPDNVSAEDLALCEETTVIGFITAELSGGISHSQKSLADNRSQLGLSRDRLRAIVHKLIETGELTERNDPGKSNTLIPATLAGTNGEGR